MFSERKRKGTSGQRKAYLLIQNKHIPLCVDLISGNSADPTFFVLPDITAQLSELENEKDLTDEERLAALMLLNIRTLIRVRR